MSNTTAKTIVEYLGGSENINVVSHCATRLRFDIKNHGLIHEESLKGVNGVLGIVDKGGVYQVVIGPAVSKLYDEITPLLHKNAVGGIQEVDTEDNKQTPWMDTVLSYISGSISPILPVIIAAGMINAILAVATKFGLSNTDGTYITLRAIANVGFTFLPMFVAFAAARKLKTDEYVAAFLALAMVVSFNQQEGMSLFGIAIPLVKYSNAIIPALLMVPCLKIIDKYTTKIIPSSALFTVKPLVLVLISAPLLLFVFGPVGSLVGTLLANFTIWMMDKVGAISLAVMAGFHNITTMFGVQYLFTPIMANEIAETGATFVLSRSLAGNFAAAGAALAVGLKAKNLNNKQLGISSSLTAFLGITEPALFGCLIRLKRPLVAACAAAAVSGAFLGIFQVKAYAIAAPGLLSLPIFIGGEGMTNFYLAIAGAVIAAALGFVFTWLIGFKED